MILSAEDAVSQSDSPQQPLLHQEQVFPPAGGALVFVITFCTTRTGLMQLASTFRRLTAVNERRSHYKYKPQQLYFNQHEGSLGEQLALWLVWAAEIRASAEHSTLPAYLLTERNEFFLPRAVETNLPNTAREVFNQVSNHTTIL